MGNQGSGSKRQNINQNQQLLLKRQTTIANYNKRLLEILFQVLAKKKRSERWFCIRVKQVTTLVMIIVKLCHGKKCF